VIVEADPKSGAARAFSTLAEHFLDVRRELLGEARIGTDETPVRRRQLLRKGR
jgi:hypothetical protein